jgi:hypothetical protein
VTPSPRGHCFFGLRRQAGAAKCAADPSAPIGHGCTEANLGRALREIDRPGIVHLATKARLEPGDLANVRAAIPGIEAFAADNTHTGYIGATVVKLQASYDAGIKNVTLKGVNGTGYCLENTKPVGVLYHKSGPGGDIVPNGC